MNLHISRLKSDGFKVRELLDAEYSANEIWEVYVDGNARRSGI